MNQRIPNDNELAEAYRTCRRTASSHYENFPVASWLLPRQMRDPVAAVYAFARAADDFADEGELGTEERLAHLDRWEELLELSVDGRPPGDEPVFVALADLFRRHTVPPHLFRDLLDAFRQDVQVRRYASFEEVRDYCRRSANPVGQILLHLHGSAKPELLSMSDDICTALQLLNFWQDLAQDALENDRIYLPLDEMARFGVTEQQVLEQQDSDNMHALMRFQHWRIEDLLNRGAPLALRIPGRFGWELRAICAGAYRVLERLKSANDPFARPRLRFTDLLPMTWHIARFRRRHGRTLLRGTEDCSL